MNTLKSIAAIFVGLMASFIMIILLEKVSHGQMMIPEGIDPATPEGAAELIAQAPVSALIWVVLGYLLGSLVGAVVAQLIRNDSRRLSAYLTGLILLVLAVVNLFAIPHPFWMVASSIVAIILGTLIGGRIVRTKGPAHG